MGADLGNLARQTAGRLAADHVQVVVAAVGGSSAEIRSAGTTGVADRAPGADSIFEIGSITKVFTALALAKQSLAGLVDLDEPVRQLLPAGVHVPSRAGREITLRQLATHTSGLPRLPKGMLWRALLHPNEPDPYAQYSAEVIFEGLSRTKLHAPPGDRFRYSNLGGGLLGLALATRAGTTYESVIDAEVCRPLGLTDTHITPSLEQAERIAQGHTRKRKVTPLWNLNALAGAGALRSTAADLVQFVRAQLEPGTSRAGRRDRIDSSAPAPDQQIVCRTPGLDGSASASTLRVRRRDLAQRRHRRVPLLDRLHPRQAGRRGCAQQYRAFRRRPGLRSAPCGRFRWRSSRQALGGAPCQRGVNKVPLQARDVRRR